MFYCLIDRNIRKRPLPYGQRSFVYYRIHGAGIGWGVGQLYLRQNNRWLLVGGFCDYEEDEIENEMDEEVLFQLIDNLFPPMQNE